MSEDKPGREGFAARWSRRKLNSDAADRPGLPPAATPSQAPEPFADFDFGSLDFNSDYRRFMAGAVSDAVRNTALQKLWSSSDLIAKPDDLDDYLEDFREEAMAIPPGLAHAAHEDTRDFSEHPGKEPAIDTPPSGAAKEAGLGGSPGAGPEGHRGCAEGASLEKSKS